MPWWANTKYETFNQEYSQFNTDLGWEGIYDKSGGNHVKSPGVYEDASCSRSVMANYSYKGRYLLKASMRADGSSKLVPITVGDSFHPVRWVGEFEELRMCLGWRRT